MVDMREPGAIQRDHPPAHGAEAGIEAENANRGGAHADLCARSVRMLQCGKDAKPGDDVATAASRQPSSFAIRASDNS